MPGDNDDHKGQLLPFTPPKFNWGQDNLYEQFKSFKHVVDFAFKGQYAKCANSVKCGSVLNWLGIEAYPVYDNLPISEEDKQDPSKLLDTFNSISNQNGTFSSRGTHWGLYTAEHSKLSQTFIISSIVWLMTVTLQIRMR